MKRIGYLSALLITLILAAFAREFEMPKLVPASSMACREAHPDEKVTLGVDPYDTQEKASIFHSPMLEHSVLPILIVFTNDGDEPVVLSHARFELITRDRAKAEPYSLDDLRRVLSAIRAPGSRAEDKLPIPLPGKGKAHGGLSQQQRDEIEHSSFAAHAVEPHASQQGFLFFDVGDLDHPTRGAHLFVTDVNNGHGKELFYFDVPLGRP